MSKKQQSMSGRLGNIRSNDDKPYSNGDKFSHRNGHSDAKNCQRCKQIHRDLFQVKLQYTSHLKELQESHFKKETFHLAQYQSIVAQKKAVESEINNLLICGLTAKSCFTEVRELDLQANLQARRSFQSIQKKAETMMQREKRQREILKKLKGKKRDRPSTNNQDMTSDLPVSPESYLRGNIFIQSNSTKKEVETPRASELSPKKGSQSSVLKTLGHLRTQSVVQQSKHDKIESLPACTALESHIYLLHQAKEALRMELLRKNVELGNLLSTVEQQSRMIEDYEQRMKECQQQKLEIAFKKEKQLKSKDIEISLIDGTIGDLEQQLRMKQEELISLNDQFQQISDEEATARYKNGELSQMIQRLTKDISIDKQSRQVLEAQINTQIAEHTVREEALLIQIQSYSRQLQKETEDNKRLNGIVLLQENHLKDKETYRNQLIDTANDIEKKIMTVHSELSAKMSYFQQILNNLSKKAQECSLNKTIVLSTREKLKQVQECLEKERKTVQSTEERNEDLKKTQSELLLEITALSLKNEQLEEKNEQTLIKEIDSSQQLQESKKKLIQLAKAFAQNQSQLANQQQQLETQGAQISQITARKTIIQRQLQEAKLKIKEQVSLLSIAAKAIEKGKMDLEATSQTLQKQRELFKKKANQMEQIQTDFKKTIAERQKQEHTIIQVKRQLTEAEANFEQIQSKLEKQSGLLKQETQKLNQAEAKFEQIQSKLEKKVTEQIEQANQEIEKIRSELERKIILLTSVTQKWEQAETNLEKTKSEVQKQSALVLQMTVKWERALTKSEQTNSQREKQSASLKQVSQQLAETKIMFDQIQFQLSKQRALLLQMTEKQRNAAVELQETKYLLQKQSVSLLLVKRNLIQTELDLKETNQKLQKSEERFKVAAQSLYAVQLQLRSIQKLKEEFEGVAEKSSAEAESAMSELASAKQNICDLSIALDRTTKALQEREAQLIQKSLLEDNAANLALIAELHNSNHTLSVRCQKINTELVQIRSILMKKQDQINYLSRELELIRDMKSSLQQEQDQHQLNLTQQQKKIKKVEKGFEASLSILQKLYKEDEIEQLISRHSDSESEFGVHPHQADLDEVFEEQLPPSIELFLQMPQDRSNRKISMKSCRENRVTNYTPDNHFDATCNEQQFSGFNTPLLKKALNQSSIDQNTVFQRFTDKIGKSFEVNTQGLREQPEVKVLCSKIFSQQNVEDFYESLFLLLNQLREQLFQNKSKQKKGSNLFKISEAWSFLIPPTKLKNIASPLSLQLESKQAFRSQVGKVDSKLSILKVIHKEVKERKNEDESIDESDLHRKPARLNLQQDFQETFSDEDPDKISILSHHIGEKTPILKKGDTGEMSMKALASTRQEKYRTDVRAKKTYTKLTAKKK